jgi:cardiolipin synthase
VSVGSTNFDNRSFKLNDEATLNIYDAKLAQRMGEVFDADIAQADEVTFAQWARRPWRERLAERFALIFRSQM